MIIKNLLLLTVLTNCITITAILAGAATTPGLISMTNSSSPPMESHLKYHYILCSLYSKS